MTYIGTPFEQRDTTNDFTRRQNKIVRDHAIRHGRGYFDGMTPFLSYESMVANGYLDDAVHPSFACYVRMAELAWEELSFFAIGVERRMEGLVMNGKPSFRWNAVPGVRYLLEMSSDLRSWAATGPAVRVNQASIHTWTPTESPGGERSFFRLSVLPP